MKQQQHCGGGGGDLWGPRKNHAATQPSNDWHIESPVPQWLERPTRSRRVVGSNPIWDSDFFPRSP